MQSSVSSARLIATVRRHRSLDVVHEDRFAATFFQADSEKICEGASVISQRIVRRCYSLHIRGCSGAKAVTLMGREWRTKT